MPRRKKRALITMVVLALLVVLAATLIARVGLPGPLGLWLLFSAVGISVGYLGGQIHVARNGCDLVQAAPSPRREQGGGVIIYSNDSCPYCRRAKALLDSKGVDYLENTLDLNDAEARRNLAKLTGRRTVPQIVIDGQPIGGWNDLSALEKAGELDRRLAA